MLYWSWAIFTGAALVVSYAIDPYAFAFTALGLAWLTGAVTIVAVATVALWAWDWTWGRRLLMVAGVVAAVMTVASALAILRTFGWN